jgi:hypothetical protein
MVQVSRSQQVNPNDNDLFVAADGSPWLPLAHGISLRVLRISPETGHTTVLFRIPGGTRYPRHKHLGGSEYYVVSGRMDLRGGAQNGGVSATAGDYGYEANGAIHEETYFPEDTELFFVRYGPSAMIDDDGNIISLLDWQALSKIEVEGLAALAAVGQPSL